MQNQPQLEPLWFEMAKIRKRKLNIWSRAKCNKKHREFEMKIELRSKRCISTHNFEFTGFFQVLVVNFSLAFLFLDC